MATLVLRDLDDELVARLRARAAVNERTVEAEARESLAKDLDGFDDWIAELLAFHSEMIAKYGVFPDSTPMLREMRDE